MRQSELFSVTRKEAPREEESKNAQLLLRGGYIDKTMAGVYSYLPLGLKVLQKVSAIVREEMNKLPHAQEVLMPALQPKELWMEVENRWADAEEVMYRVEGGEIGLGPTHEEIVTDLFRKVSRSYKDLPIAVYQIQTKFRKEARAKSGLLRGREFVMKDLYSFHATQEDFDAFYNQVAEAYLRVFTRCGLHALRTLAGGGMFSKLSDEFQVMSETGEDLIYLRADGQEARNKEIVPDENDPELKEYCGGEIKTANSIEVGNIFPLGKRFSGPMDASVTDEAGERVEMLMGCYGLGVSRLIGSMVEVLAESPQKMAWPEEVAPFKIHLIDLCPDVQALPVYEKLKTAGFEVLYDDREKSAGEKFADADLIGAPWRLIVSKRSLEAGGVEVKDVHQGTTEIVAVDQVVAKVQAL